MTRIPSSNRKRSPYLGLSRKAYWKTAVAGRTPDELSDVYVPKIKIDANSKVATAGSCFAQHIARHLKSRGVPVMDLEPAPPGLKGDSARSYGFGMYSARFGNIYYLRQLLQLLREARGQFLPQNSVWEKQGRYYDALRPNVEPNGLSSPEDVIRLREKHIAAVAQMFETCDIFIFTLGLTEAWVDRTSGTVYPTAPGTIAGNYDPETVEFKNFTFGEVLDDLKAFRGELLEVNPNANILLTVSPVGLAATATEGHVLTSSVYSKSVLRAAAGQMANEYDNVDYFPSYEIVNSAASKGRFFDETYRDVTAAGVSTAMSHFLRAFPDLSEFKPTSSTHENELELAICEEILVEEFAK